MGGKFAIHAVNYCCKQYAVSDRYKFMHAAVACSKYYYYEVRAVSPGTYTTGPVMADAMYNGEYHSYHGVGVVRVSNR